MIIPGVVAQVSSGGGGYTANWVQFGADSFVGNIGNPGFSANSKITTHCWVNDDDLSTYPALVDFMDGGLTELGYNFASDVTTYLQSGGSSLTFGSDDGVLTTGVKHSIFMSADTNFSAGNKVKFCYVDGVNVLNEANTIDASAAFNIPWAGESGGQVFYLPTFPAGAGSTSTGRKYADFQMWIGQAIDPTVPGNLAKFFNAGNPVDPADAATAFGQQTVLFSGNASGFATNQGSLGTFGLARGYAQVAGHNGAGSIALGGAATIGESVLRVIHGISGADISAAFESTISVTDHIQQTAATDYSAVNIAVFLPGTLTDA